LFVCLLQDASGHSNVLKAGKAEELKMLGKGELPEKPTNKQTNLWASTGPSPQRICCVFPLAIAR